MAEGGTPGDLYHTLGSGRFPIQWVGVPPGLFRLHVSISSLHRQKNLSPPNGKSGKIGDNRSKIGGQSGKIGENQGKSVQNRATLSFNLLCLRERDEDLVLKYTLQVVTTRYSFLQYLALQRGPGIIHLGPLSSKMADNKVTCKNATFSY